MGDHFNELEVPPQVQNVESAFEASAGAIQEEADSDFDSEESDTDESDDSFDQDDGDHGARVPELDGANDSGSQSGGTGVVFQDPLNQRDIQNGNPSIQKVCRGRRCSLLIFVLVLVGAMIAI